MWRFSIVLLTALSAASFLGCGQAASAPRPLTADQERQLEEKRKQVETEERQHQQEMRNSTAGAPKR